MNNDPPAGIERGSPAGSPPAVPVPCEAGRVQCLRNAVGPSGVSLLTGGSRVRRSRGFPPAMKALMRRPSLSVARVSLMLWVAPPAMAQVAPRSRPEPVDRRLGQRGDVRAGPPRGAERRARRLDLAGHRRRRRKQIPAARRQRPLQLSRQARRVPGHAQGQGTRDRRILDPAGWCRPRIPVRVAAYAGSRRARCVARHRRAAGRPILALPHGVGERRRRAGRSVPEP